MGERRFSDLFPQEQSARGFESSLFLAAVLKENLCKAVNDAARKVTLRGKQVIVPLKFDEDGNPTAVDTIIFKRLTLRDLRFLGAWRSANWDVSKAISESGLSSGEAERLVKKLSCFREEDARVKALCEIPTPDWIAAKHVQNVYEGGTLQDSEHKSLAELAKIEGAYKQQAVNTQINVFNLPELPPEQAAKVKEVFDTIALEQSDVAA